MGKKLRIFHLTMMFVWVGLAFPGLILWKESIWFIIVLSLYANFIGEFSAYQAARAETKQDNEGGE